MENGIYVVIWLKTSGIEFHRLVTFTDAEEAYKCFKGWSKQVAGFTDFDISSAKDLEVGKRLVCASGTQDIIHARRTHLAVGYEALP